MDDDGGPSQNNNTSLPVTLDDEIVNTSQAAETATSHVLREDAKSPEKDKHRLTKTVCLYLTELGLGLAASVLGPTLPNMEEFLGVNTARISVVFTAQSGGSLVGSLLAGLFYDRLDREMQFAVGGILSGLCTALAPWARSVLVFCIFMSIQGVTMGYIDAGSQPYCMDTWQGSKKKNPVLVGLHSLWSLGSTCAPMLITFFLSPLQKSNNQFLENAANYSTGGNFTNAISTNYTLVADSVHVSNSNYTGQDMTIRNADSVDDGLVRFAFLTVGILIIATSIGFSILVLKKLCRGTFRFFVSDKPFKVGRTSSYRPQRRTFNLVILSVLFTFFVFFQWLEDVPSLLLATFVTSGMNWSVRNGSLITSLFWLLQGAGSLAGICVSTYMSAHCMILINMLMGLCAWCILMPYGMVPSWVIWLSAALGGLCISTTYASALLWCSRHLRVSGMASGLFLIGSSLGGMTGPPLVGYLMETYTHMAMVYVCLATVLMTTLIFAILLLFARLYPRDNDPSTVNINKDDKKNITL